MTTAEQIFNTFHYEKKDVRFVHYYVGINSGVVVQRYDWALIYEFKDGSIIRVSDSDVEIIK